MKINGFWGIMQKNGFLVLIIRKMLKLETSFCQVFYYIKNPPVAAFKTSYSYSKGIFLSNDMFIMTSQDQGELAIASNKRRTVVVVGQNAMYQARR